MEGGMQGCVGIMQPRGAPGSYLMRCLAQDPVAMGTLSLSLYIITYTTPLYFSLRLLSINTRGTSLIPITLSKKLCSLPRMMSQYASERCPSVL